MTQVPMGETFGVPPQTYNRFLGNPPAGVDPITAYTNEMGFPPVVYQDLSAVQADIADLTTQVSTINAQLSTLSTTVSTLSVSVNTNTTKIVALNTKVGLPA